MRILKVGDIHYTMSNPERRIDCYYESINRKLEEIAVISKDYDVVLFVGDWGHKKTKMTWLEWNMLADKIKSMHGDKYGNPGNHDLWGGQYESWKVQPTGALVKAGILQLVNEQGVLLEGDVKVQINAVKFSYVNQLSNYSLSRNSIADYVITLTHDMLFTEPPPYDAHYLLVSEVMSAFQGDVLVNGHLHNLQYILDFGKKHFIQLGSISRGVLKLDDKDRPIQVIGGDYTKDGIKFTTHQLTMVRPFSEVFNVNAYIKEKESEESFEQFTDSVIAEVASVEQYDVQTLVRNMEEFKSLPPEVREVVERYLSKVGA